MTARYVTEAVLMVLSDDWQSTSEIHSKILADRGAVDMALRRLFNAGAIECRESRTVRRRTEWRIKAASSEVPE